MKLKEYDILIDLKKHKQIEDIEIVTGDFGSNIFKISIVEGVENYELAGLNIEIAFAKPDGTTVLQDLNNGIELIGNKIVCTLKTNTIASPGKVFAEIRVSEDLKLLTTARFNFNVRKAIVNDETIESTDEFPILNEKIKEVNDLIEEVKGMKPIKGDKGDKGDGAYQVWLGEGNIGTIEDYLESLKGDTGEGLNILGQLESESELPTTGDKGDAYLINDVLYIWDGVSFINVGSIKGEKGDKGDTGEKGIQGERGLQGEKGDKGDAGSIDDLEAKDIENALGYTPVDASLIGLLASLTTEQKTNLVAAINEIDSNVKTHKAESASKHIKESGSNENGDYIKFDDGTMICFGVKTFATSSITNPWGTVFTGGTTNRMTITYPASFITMPAFSLTNQSDQNALVMTYDTIDRTTSIRNIELLRGTSLETLTPKIYFVAVGRWK